MDMRSICEKYDPEQDQFCDLFARLSRSNFRSRFHLKDKDIQYIREKGEWIPSAVMPQILCEHVWLRLRFPMMVNKLNARAPCIPGSACYWLLLSGDACIKWHRIPAGVRLTEEQQEYIVDVLMAWIEREYNRNA